MTLGTIVVYPNNASTKGRYHLVPSRNIEVYTKMQRAL
jgi:hypothetical protein